jgi:hypothetical protein
MGKVDENAIQAALEWHKENPRKNSLRQAAIQFNVKRSTLRDRSNNQPTRKEVDQAKQVLLPAEEDTLEDAALAHCDFGFPVRRRQVRSWGLQIVVLR